MSRGTAPQRLIVKIDGDTCCEYCYLVVGVTIPVKGPMWGPVQNRYILFLTLG